MIILLCVGAVAAQDPVDFDSQIRVLLSDRCYGCHGPDDASREADLRLDDRDSAYSVISAGHPEDSEMIRRIESDDPYELMPPPDSNLALSADERALLRRWVQEGAQWSEHWSFVPVPPQVEVPQVDDPDWPRNPIDHFIWRKLRRHNLSPSEAADKPTLLRRLSYDLTGLPPTTSELNAFLQDNSPDAYERQVDRLLASPRFGERMASQWLDVARYSDTFGYQVDRDRRVWPYRDWVVEAFNRNQPYDEFVTWQLAGDLLPNATDEQVLATAFNRLHPQKSEGGSIPEEFRNQYVADRVQTVATGLMGLTLECARCHEHKFDPISQKEFYQLYAYFNNIEEEGLYSYFTDAVPTPTLELSDDADKAKIAELRQQVADTEARIRAHLQQPFQAESSIPNPLDYGMLVEIDFEEIADQDGIEQIQGIRGTGIRVSGDDEFKIAGYGNFRRYQPFSISLWINTPDEKQRAVVFHRSRAAEGAGSRGYQLLIEDGHLTTWLVHFMPVNSLGIRMREKIPVQQWIHVTVTYDGSSRADGVKLYVDGQLADTEIVRDNLTREITGGGGDNFSIGARFRDRGFTNGSVDDVKLFSRRLVPLEVKQLFDGQALQNALENPGGLAPHVAQQLDEFIREVSDRELVKLQRELQKHRQALCRAMDKIPEIMVMREMETRRETYVLKRGDYDQPGEHVTPGTPEFLPPFPEDAPANRLGLARWLTDPGHPLTARVAVNRYWQLCFGRGLVGSPEDFGVQGKRPTHPELLNWLARDFMDSDWDVKALLKKMVMSATYRQSSLASAEALSADPQNLWLSRAPRYRWPAEMLRDSALYTSGMLVEKIGGPPVKPYDLEASFNPVKVDKGEKLYRRSLYTYWKQSGPAPAMMALDASKREVCRVARHRTDSPVQPLILMNGTQFVEAARNVARRALFTSDDREVQIEKMFRLLTGRDIDDEEKKILMGLYERQLKHFADQPEAIQQLMSVGQPQDDRRFDPAEWAAATVVANTIMNFDEFTMKR